MRSTQPNLATSSKHSITRVVGIDFSDLPCETLLANHATNGGLLVVPSGPGLATLDRDNAYRNALQDSDYAIVDSGYLALLWCATFRGRLRRVSGLEFIDTFLKLEALKAPRSSFWLLPKESGRNTTLEYIKARGIQIHETHVQIAPMYPSDGPVEDSDLLATLDELHPHFVILNIAGGKQEKLGHYLQQNLSYKPAIICTGAAIAFLTGHQVKIPMWADRLYLGWLWRCIDKPSVYIPRYWSAIRLAYLVFRYKEKLPPMKASKS